MTNPTKSAAMMTLRLNEASYLRSGGRRLRASSGTAVAAGSDMRFLQPRASRLRVLGLEVGAEHAPDQEALAQRRQEPAGLAPPGPGLARGTHQREVHPVQSRDGHGDRLH